MKRRSFGTAIGNAKADEHVVGRGLGILDLHVEVASAFEDADNQHQEDEKA